MRLSAYICTYRDTEFLEHVVDTIYDIVDELVIVDGPYRFIVEYYRGMPLEFGSTLGRVRPRGVPLLALSKVVYLSKTWTNQQEKRKAAYERCTGDIVLVIDGDEFWNVDCDVLEEFHRSDYAVGSMDAIQLCRSNAALGQLATGAIDPTGITKFRKPNVFKRAQITAAEHLDYIWITDHAADSSPRSEFPKPMGLFYNLILMRTAQGQFEKYLYYRTRYLLAEKLSDPLLASLQCSNYSEVARRLSLETFASFILRGSFDAMRCPRHYLIVREFDDSLLSKESLRTYDDVQGAYGVTQGAHVAWPLHIEYHFYLPPSIEKEAVDLHFDVEGTTELTVRDYPIWFEADNTSNARLMTIKVRKNRASIRLAKPEPKGTQELFARIVVICLLGDGHGLANFRISMMPLGEYPALFSQSQTYPSVLST